MALKLSQLAYEIVRDSIVMPNDTEITYDDFINNEVNFENNTDWSMQYRLVFTAINRAIARLVAYDKLPYYVAEFPVQTLAQYKQSLIDGGSEGITINANDYLRQVVDLTTLDYRKIMNVVTPQYSNWLNYSFNIENKILYLHGFATDSIIKIEYQKRIPRFKKSDIVGSEIATDGVDYVDNNIDLEDYGFDELAFEFVKAYATSIILKELDPAQANNELMIAENYFSDMEKRLPTYNQTKIVRVLI